MKPRCDCLNFCGDDPYLDKGLVRPCPTFKAEIDTRRLHDAAPELLKALKQTLDLAIGHACEARKINADECESWPWVQRARAAIRKVEGK